MVHMDKDVLSFVVEVILDNVVTHCPEGREVKIYMEKEANGSYLAIEDNGQGISAEHLSRIGNPFEIESDGMTAQKGGLALSLFLAKQQMKAIGGKIMFLSEPGKGLTVKLYLQEVL